MSILTDDVCETLMLTSQGIKAGLSFPEAIRLSVGQQPGPTQHALLLLAKKIESGAEPKTAIRRVGLPKKLVDLLDVSLESHDFGSMFDQLVKIEESRTSTFRLLMQSFPYFLLLLVATICVFGFLLAYIVPQFEAVFTDFDTELPAMTLMLIMFSHLLRHPVFWISVALGLLVFYFLTKLLCPRALFYLPIYGKLRRSTYRGNFLRQLALQISQNVPLPDALRSCAKMMSNPVYRRDCLDASQYAQYGASLKDIAAKYYWLFPGWCVSAFSQGSSKAIAPSEATQSIASNSEATKTLDAPQPASNSQAIVKTLNQAADDEFGQKEDALVLVQSLTVPLCIMFIGCFVGMIVTAMFLPLIKLITELS